MPLIKLSQTVVQKHFMERNTNVNTDSRYWLDRAIENHIERGSIGNSRINTLIFVKPQAWQSMITGTYFESRNAPIVGGQIAVTVAGNDIDRIISTERSAAGEYDSIYDTADGDAKTDVVFLCNYDGVEFEFVHFEGLGNPEIAV